MVLGCARAFAPEQRPPTVLCASRARLAQLPYCRRHESRAKLRSAVSFNCGTVQDRTLTKPGCQPYTNELIRVFFRRYAHALIMQGPESIFRVTKLVIDVSHKGFAAESFFAGALLLFCALAFYYFAVPPDGQHYYMHSRIWHYRPAEALALVKRGLNESHAVYALFASRREMEEKMVRLPHVDGFEWVLAEDLTAEAAILKLSPGS